MSAGDSGTADGTDRAVRRSAVGAVFGAVAGVSLGAMTGAVAAMLFALANDFAGSGGWAGLAGWIVAVPVTIVAMLGAPAVGSWWWLRRAGEPGARRTGVVTAVLTIPPVVAGSVVLQLPAFDHPVALVGSECVAVALAGAAARLATGAPQDPVTPGRVVAAVVVTLAAAGLVVGTVLL